MYVKVCAALVVIQILAGMALAANNEPLTGTFNTFQDTPEEQAACDSTKFCRDAIPDTFRVLTCLQENRSEKFA